MKRIPGFVTGICFFFCHLSAFAQDSSAAVQWQQSNAGSQAAYQLFFKAKIEKGWKLFSVTMKDDLPNTRVLLDSGSAAISAVTEIGKIQSRKDPLFDNANLSYFEDAVEIQVKLNNWQTAKVIQGQINYMAIRNDSVIGPLSFPFRYVKDPNGALIAQTDAMPAAGAFSLKRANIDLAHPVNACGGTGAENAAAKSLWSIFILGFLGGLIALLTPCVFPMIPLTVSFFTKKAHGRSKGTGHALLYGFFIVLIYTLLSMPFHFLDSVNPEILNNISTNVWLNMIFFVVFVFFALSFFGLFEITLPSGVANSVGARSGTSGIGGIFFMALTLALVSFSCTGPILGSLLAGSLSSNGGANQLSAGMAGFGFALALPFALFAMFPKWLHALPRSGGWLNSVKIVLGFVEIALAVKFLSNADLVEHWGILKREVFLAVWVITGFGVVLYLLGVMKFHHDPPPQKLSRLRISVAAFFLIFTLYLIPGLFKTKHANLSLISGFPPPLSYSVYGKELVKLCGLEASVINDYQRALAEAQKTNKPILIDFTGWACVNCRKMEENVWTDPDVKKTIQDKFILLSLYVDDRKLLPVEDQFTYNSPEGNKKLIRTVGDEFATLQSANFLNASQPLYAVISPDEKLLSYPVGYTPDAKKYLDWLNCGLDALHTPR